MKNNPYAPYPLLFLKIFSYVLQQGSLLHFRLMQNTSPSTLLLALNQTIFCADMGVNLSYNGEKVHLSSVFILRATQPLHALIFSLFFFAILSLSLIFFFLSLAPPSFFKSLGSSWCHSMRHCSSGAILYCGMQ